MDTSPHTTTSVSVAQPSRGRSTRFWLKVSGLVLLVSVLLLSGLIYGVYWLGWQGPLVQAVERIVPLPVVLVGRHSISRAEYTSRLAAYQQAIAYNQAFDFADPKNQELVRQQKTALRDRMIDLKLQQILADTRGIRVSEEEITKELDTIALQATVPTEKLDEVLFKIYGWRRAEFVSQLVVPQIRERKLEQAVAHDSVINAKASARAQEVRSKLAAGGDFAVLAKEYSDDPVSKQVGGDLGWQPKGALVPEFEEAASKLKPGEVSGIVTSVYGFHIIQMIERTDKDPQQSQIHTRHILVAGKDFSEWLAEQAKAANIWKFPLP